MAKSTKRPRKKAGPAKRRAVKKPARAKAAKPVKKPAPKPAQRVAPPRVRAKRQLRPSPQPPRRQRIKAPASAYDELPRTPANFQPLTPLTMLERAANVFPDRIAIIHGRQRTTYAQFYRRCRKLASALANQGIGKNDTVAAMLANTPAMLEAHYGVPMAGGVLNALNTRLDAASIAFMLEHGDAKILITDREFSATVSEALKLLKHPPLVIDYDDPEYSQSGEKLGEDYESFIAEGDPDFAWAMPADEWDAISLNYTSGTTGNPKGVVYPSSRRRADGLQQRPGGKHGPPSGPALDLAHVSLQRLVLSLVLVGGGGHPCLPALGAGGRDLPGAGGTWRHPSLRRTHRDVGLAGRPGR